MIVRFAVLIQSMYLGIRVLNFSVNVSMVDADDKGKSPKEGSALPVVLSMAVGVAAAVFLFILLPLWITSWP